jgi:hypothetical protein
MNFDDFKKKTHFTASKALNTSIELYFQREDEVELEIPESMKIV